LAGRLASAFALHPRVARVTKVVLDPRSIKVELVYK
jgi:hypothetical protein